MLSVSVTLGVALLLDRFHFRDLEVPLFLFAVALAAWYAGPGPAVLTPLLLCLSLDYFFLEPIYSFELSGDLPYLIIFASFASLITWFSTVRLGVEGELHQALDRLEIEVAERTQQASLLNVTHDTIFVRDMNDVITYWNQGVQELYGWTTETRSANTPTSFCVLYFRRQSRRFARSCCAPGVGTANSRSPGPTEPR